MAATKKKSKGGSRTAPTCHCFDGQDFSKILEKFCGDEKGGFDCSKMMQQFFAEKSDKPSKKS
ncbi:hypothetical protein ACFL35_00705 [Candidatus Riflebacteria bacterium]